ncbi:hypothetical protein GF374_00190 [Candidatus Woesearchaeota archaeon]|nr:hypothetical protein [Candidatus Woesearchaeota archaeon]
MDGYLIYPADITEIFIGRVEIEGYDCPKSSCISVNGYIEQNEIRKTLYVDCAYGKRGDTCEILSDIINNEKLGLKKKRGNQENVLMDLIEALEKPKVREAHIPFKINKLDISLDKLTKFFEAFLEYETETYDIHDNGFTLYVKKPEKRNVYDKLKNIGKEIKTLFTTK